MPKLLESHVDIRFSPREIKYLIKAIAFAVTKEELFLFESKLSWLAIPALMKIDRVLANGNISIKEKETAGKNTDSEADDLAQG